MDEKTAKARFPSKLQFLFRPYRYKVARGGRSAAKSWGFARTLLIKGMSNRLRILCAREVQLSIKQSVHKLLSDQISLMDISNFYEVYEASIKGRNGTEFAFSGLSSLTVDTIKSFEGYDVCWVEEGQAITKRSWDILIPTIRKEDSEIWISYNPDLETDETHQRFTINPPHNCYNQEINWRDNPWFNAVMEEERQHCLRTDPDNYDNIWEGKCRPAVEGAVFFKQIQEAEAQKRICNVPYDPMLKVHLVFDLGWEDSLACSLVQRLTSEIRVIRYLEASHTSLDAFSDELVALGLNWGKVWLPHDGFSKKLESGGKSTEDILKALGWNVATRSEITVLDKEEGIRQTRMIFPRIYFDQKNTHAAEPLPAKTEKFHPTKLNGRLIEAVKRYRRSINRQTEAPGATIKDEYAHGADNLRYVALNADNMTNEADRSGLKKPMVQKRLRPGQAQSWMGA